MRRAVTSLLLPAALTAVSALTVSGGAIADPIGSKQAEANRVLQEVNRINAALEQRINAYDQAQIELQHIRHQLGETKAQLRLTLKNLRAAKLAQRRRIAAVYTSGDQTSSLAVVLGARSFGDLVDRLDESQRVSQQDTRIVRQVVGLQAALDRRVAALRKAQVAQKKVVATRAAERRYIEGQVRLVNAKLASIRQQIAQMKAAEARRQERLRREAAARLALWKKQQEALAQQALARANAVQSQPTGALTMTDPTASTSTEPSLPVPPSSIGAEVVSIAMQYLGVPYQWAGADPSTGFDCSGFTMYVFSKVGISLPHLTYSQFAGGTPVPRDQLQPGDLVFFDGVGHVGIYVGGGNFIHAPQTGDVVKISPLSYEGSYDGARRYGISS
jgi:cell wall-associated NlpC family hydrolase